MNNELNSFVKDISQQYIFMLKDWIPADSSIAIAVEHSYVYFHSGHQSIHLEIGQQVLPGSIADQVLQTQKKTDAILDNSLFDTPYYGIGYPIYIQNKPAALVIVLPSSFTTKRAEPYQFLTGKQEEEWNPVAINKISHIESLQKKTWFYVEGDQYKTSITLKELQLRLPSYFIRIHRSYIVNIHFIKKMARDLTSNFIVTLIDGSELPVSQSYLNDLRNALEF
ncbi:MULTISPECIES: LytTR family DNA-binding domain-containing protein [Lysinibacillus]|uniref:Histidine kinase n=1 Tax=Lysinibacillus boronitolerans JCM 21713 = 10a = NBRC 103108 TaxID=1294264 RepID=A0ABR4Y4J6_9BACI|nr:LytTR family DNA-binding domain-containing protein [Lysinibacillus boronitolerans]KGR89033.1 histidine kinase [Lysinibacillus boronitolerans JCM 21713 = 10a = NBRC 103108]MCS1391307.1 LytTR family transcriptional regulator [Lysinibacillus boronitolerans]